MARASRFLSAPSASSRATTCAAAAMAASGLRTSWAKLRAAFASASCRARSSASRRAASAADSSRNTATTPPPPSRAVVKPSSRSPERASTRSCC